MKPSLRMKVEQRLQLNQEMQLALSVLTMPLGALEDWLTDQVLDNPELSFANYYQPKIDQRSAIIPSNEQIIAAKPSLYETLLQQVLISFPEERKIAEEILGTLDEKGFFTGDLVDIATLINVPIERVKNTLTKIQRLSPVGIGSKHVQEALLIQLIERQEQGTLAYQILDAHYQDLLLGRKEKIMKHLKVGISAFNDAMQTITKLSPFPGRGFASHVNPIIRAECSIVYLNKLWHINYRSDDYPSLVLSPPTEDPIRQKNHRMGKWLIKTLWKRKETIEKVLRLILAKQEEYLLEKQSAPYPITLSEAASKLEMHISTLSRALQGKYIETPLGLLPLTHFFSAAIGKTKECDVSIEKAKKLLQELINTENKKKPHPDETLRALLKQKGVICSRRTVTKYRLLLNIPSTRLRKAL